MNTAVNQDNIKLKIKDLIRYFSGNLENLPIIGQIDDTITVGKFIIKPQDNEFTVYKQNDFCHSFSIRSWALAFSVKSHKNNNAKDLVNYDNIYKRLSYEKDYLEQKLDTAQGIKQDIIQSRLDRVESEMEMIVFSVSNDIKTAFSS